MHKTVPILVVTLLLFAAPDFSYSLIAVSLDYPVSEQEYVPGSYAGRSFFYDNNHLGEDIDFPEKKPIKAIGHGTLVWYSSASGYGELVAVIEHDLGQEYNFINAYGNTVTTRKILSIYGHIRKSEERAAIPLGWQVGNEVKKGDFIGYVNNSSHPDLGNPDPNGDGLEHLHMGIRLSDKATAATNDPGKWFRGYENDTDFGRDFASALQVIQAHRTPNTGLLFSFKDFSNISQLALNGSANPVKSGDGQILRLVPALESQAGTTFFNQKMNISSFNTSFKFRITNPGGYISDCNGETGADGIIFIIQPTSLYSIGNSGGGLGYGGITNSIGIEFDMWCNSEIEDRDSNHVAILTNGDMTHQPLQTASVIPNFDDGNVWYGWIDYDGATLEVRVNQTGVKPANPMISQVLDIPQILGASLGYAGFGAGTGAAWGDHDILSWDFEGYGERIEMPPTYTPVQEIHSQIDQGEKHWWDFINDRIHNLVVKLGFGSTFNIKIYKPDGSLYSEQQSNTSPIEVLIPSADPGQWRFEITAIETPIPADPYVLAIGEKKQIPLTPAFLQLLLK